jgi:hypothetical protein
MGQTPAKYFLPSAPYGASPAANALSPTQPAATNPQTPLLPPNFQSGGTLQTGATNPLATSSPTSPLGNNQNGFFGNNPILKGLFGMQ